MNDCLAPCPGHSLALRLGAGLMYIRLIITQGLGFLL